MRINIPPVTRSLLLATFAFTVLYVIARWNASSELLREPGPTPKSSIPYLTLVPSQSLYYPWTIITSTFVEQNVLNLVVNLTAVCLSGKYLERAWSSKDFAILIAVAVLIPNLLVVITYVLWGFITRSTTRANTPIAGAISLQAAFLVAFKNLIPEHTVGLYKGLVRVRVKHFPFIFLVLNSFAGIVFGTDTALLLGWYGLMTTFIYLRFYKFQAELGTRGDASETFAFATFFPNVVQPYVGTVCNWIYKLAFQARIITPFSGEAIASGNEQVAARSGELPSITSQLRSTHLREEAERRRQLALKALDERLNTGRQQASAPAAPTASTNLSTKSEQT